VLLDPLHVVRSRSAFKLCTKNNRKSVRLNILMLQLGEMRNAGVFKSRSPDSWTFCQSASTLFFIVLLNKESKDSQ
jgi:hypothetical protein